VKYLHNQTRSINKFLYKTLISILLAWFLLILSEEPKDAVLLKSEVFLIGWMPDYFSVFRNRTVL